MIDAFFIPTNLMKFLVFSFIFLSLISCDKQKIEKRARKDDTTITNYLKQQGISAQSTESGLYYTITEQGTGASCNNNSDVRVYYKGYYDNNEVFQESDASGISFNLQNVIKGWTEGIPFFKEGGKGTLYIPSSLAYGPTGRGDIAPNTVLFFDIELLEVL